jgi:Ca2+-binding EF-hand superfamily protein
VKNVDQQFADTTLAKTNLSTLKQNNAVQAEEFETLEKLLAYIKWIVSSRRVLIKSLFQDFDRAKSSVVTRDQFFRVLDSLGLVQNEQYSDLLARYYSRSTNPKEVEYLRFISDVENVKEE